MNNKGQFLIIAALLVCVILVGAVITTYSLIRDSPSGSQPQVLTAVDETNSAMKQVLAFALGYYGSVLQVTGNSSFARTLATSYLQSGLVNVANLNPEWGLSFKVNTETLGIRWFTNNSYSMGDLDVTYDLTGLGLKGITYDAMVKSAVETQNATSSNQIRLTVTMDDDVPLINLGKQNFLFYNYIYGNSTWVSVYPSIEPLAFGNGTYVINVPSGYDPYSYMVQVSDGRGIKVVASSSNSYDIALTWNQALYSTLQNSQIMVELLQNGTMLWLGQQLQTTQNKPIPPIPIREMRLNQTINGVNREVPFQIEDWNNNYQVPAGLTGNATVFGNRQMIVFLASNQVSKVTLWWDGYDTTTQTPYAYTDRYFTGDNPNNGILTNGILTLNVVTSNGKFQIDSTQGTSQSSVQFMRINNQASTYGATPAYTIYNGVVRDVIQQEAEWSNGVTNCPNLYAHIVLTLPANATYYTYKLRLMFTQSQLTRTITDLSPLMLSTSIGQPQTENGTSSGFPIVSSLTGLFYNYSASTWAHHWSQYISGTKGAGILFPDATNRELYYFDSVTSHKVGGLKIAGSGPGGTIEFDPVGQSQYPVSFLSPLDIAWYGAVSTFDGTTPISDATGQTGSWILAEYPPTTKVTTESILLKQYTITASAGTGGSIYPSGSVFVTQNDNQTFSITPAAGYSVSNVLVDGSSVGAISSYTFLRVNANHAISAAFIPKLDHFTITGAPSTVPIGQNFGGITVTAYDLNNNIITSYGGSVYFTSSDGLATLPYTSSSKYTFTSGDNGVHTFSDFKLNTGGSQTITVTDGSISTTSGAITVTGALDHFTFATISSPQTAGTAFSITITAEDVNGNTVTSYTGTNTLSVSSGTINPTSTGSFTSGVWSGSVTLTGSGSGIAISTSGSSKSGTSNSFTVSLGALDHFTFATISSPQTAGSNFAVTITAQDAYGNTVTSYGSSTALTETGGGAGGAVSPSSVTFASGVWSGNVYVTKSGSGVTVTATYGSTSSASGTFAVNAGAASKLVYTAGAGQTVGAGQVSSVVTVQRQDQYSNPVTSGSITVSLSTSQSSTGKFYSDSGETTQITSVAIGAGSSSASFYYEDTVAGTPTLTASSSGLTSATTQFTINAAASYIPVTITNIQSSATPNPFQEMITWNPSSYTSYEASDLGNIRFYSDSSLTTPLYAWLESCTPSLSKSATSATAWVKLTSPIAGNGGTLKIYMAFLPATTDFDSNYWGAAPNLSSTYGQYDNGANVFNFYDNFLGTSISSAWNTAGAAGTYFVNNGLTVNSYPFPGYSFSLNNQYTGPLVIDAYMVGTTGNWIGASFSNLQTTSGSYSVTSGATQWVYPPQGADGLNGLCIASGSTAFAPNPPSTTLQVVTLAVSSTTATEYQNYANPATASGTISLTNYPGLIQVAWNPSDIQTTYWFRLRAYSPNNVMPSVSFGSVSLAFNSLSVSIQVTDSSGNIQSTAASNVQSHTIGSSEAQYVLKLAGIQVTVPQNGYISISLSATQTASYTVYWGNGQPTNFRVPYRARF